MGVAERPFGVGRGDVRECCVMLHNVVLQEHVTDS